MRIRNGASFFVQGDRRKDLSRAVYLDSLGNLMSAGVHEA